MAKDQLDLRELARLLGVTSAERNPSAGLLLGALLGSGHLLSLEETAPSSKNSAEVDHPIGRGMTMIDLTDYVPRHDASWIAMPAPSGQKMHVSAVRFFEKDEEGAHDVHLVMLVQEEDDPDAWQIWSCCPNNMRSVVTPFRGSEEHAMRVANFMMDFFVGKVSSEEMAKEMATRTAAARRRRRQAQASED